MKSIVIKISYITLPIFFLINKATAQTTSTAPSFTAKILSWSNGVATIATTIKNNSSKTFMFLSMSCSWQDLYITDSKQLQVEKVDCLKDGPVLVKLAPHESQTKVVKLIPSKDIQPPHYIKLKIGFHLIKAKESNYKNILSKDSILKNYNIIWSDSLELKKVLI